MLLMYPSLPLSVTPGKKKKKQKKHLPTPNSSEVNPKRTNIGFI